MNDELDITLQVNGEKRALRVPPSRTLLDALRSELALTGSKNACNQGVCGACTVLIDGLPVNACLDDLASSIDSDDLCDRGLVLSHDGTNPEVEVGPQHGRLHALEHRSPRRVEHLGRHPRCESLHRGSGNGNANESFAALVQHGS